MKKVALFAGDIGLDVTMRVDRMPDRDEKIFVDELVEGIGGVIANAAIAALRAGIKPRCFLQVGDDSASSCIGRDLAALGVDADIGTVRGPLCRSVIVADRSGEKRLFLHPGVSMYPPSARARRIGLDDVGWLHTAAYDLPAAQILVERCRAENIPWSIDLEPATIVEGINTLERILDGAGVVFCNRRAAAAIGPNPAETLLRLGVRTVIHSLGDGGAVATINDRSIEVAAPTAHIVDTTGAGDCLAGWFIAEIMRGSPFEQALQQAVSAATLSCTRLGAQGSFPDRKELSSWLASQARTERVAS